MYESIVNLHMHTRYSDGTGTHADIAAAALRAGVDVVIVTDHNVLVDGPEKIYKDGKKRLMLLVGEEIHDQARDPQKNHLLVFNARRELAGFAPNPQNLIDNVRKAGGICFIAHPRDPECKPIKETDISWEDWSVQGFTGIELWNGLSEMKVIIKSYLHAMFYVYFPQFVNRSPIPEVVDRWDDMLRAGRKVVAIGGSDAHALHVSLGPLHRTVFPYEFHFRTVNTHILTPEPFTGTLESDRELVYSALAAGRCFVSLDLAGDTRGFRFTAQGKEKTAQMGEEISPENGVTFQIRLPQRTECRLLKDGKIIKQWFDRDIITHITSEPGTYRVEVFKKYLGLRRGWIFSNPIYVR
jgi:hypothetical protein